MRGTIRETQERYDWILIRKSLHTVYSASDKGKKMTVLETVKAIHGDIACIVSPSVISYEGLS